MLPNFNSLFQVVINHSAQALSSALLAIAGQETLAAALRANAQDFEMLLNFHAALTSPMAVAAVRQALAQLRSFVSVLP